MKNAIILHGQPGEEEYYDLEAPSMSNAHWIPWLQGQLLKKDIATATPEVPYAHEPDWDLWKQEVERFDIKPDTLLVGHSRGGDFWLRYLSENPDIKVGRIVLVAPSVGYLTEGRDYFGHYEIDPDMASRTKGLTIFHSDNDHKGIIDSIVELKSKLNENVVFKEFHLKHFTYGSMGTDKFPELLEELVS